MEILLIKSFTDKPWRSPDTFQRIENSLAERWPVTSINTMSPQKMYELSSRKRRENHGNLFIFNISEYLDEEHKEHFIPSLLDAWELPHLGSPLQTVKLGLDKSKAKKVFTKDRIPTPPYFVANKIDGSVQSQSEKIGFPLIVKPIAEGGHIGISDNSVVHDITGLTQAVSHILDTFRQPAIVESYINGNAMREFSVGIIESDPVFYTPIEIDFEAMDIDQPILSYETAKKDLERIKPVEDRKILQEIVRLAMRAFQSVGAHDYSRVDLRMDRTDMYVLEINLMPGLGPHSFLPAAARDLHGLEYSRLIQKLAELSMRRQGFDL